jgi:Coenzyme PQQ synthesis protein D (PqqD)
MVHAPNIVHETLDGETIIVHLETGNYYSLTGSGAEIWTLLNGAASIAAVCAELGSRHGGPEDEIRSAVESFVAELEREGLVEDGDAAPNGLPARPPGSGGPWEPPKIDRYDDMRDFLLVDPIHEVDQTGWPSRELSQAEQS